MRGGIFKGKVIRKRDVIIKSDSVYAQAFRERYASLYTVEIALVDDVRNPDHGDTRTQLFSQRDERRNGIDDFFELLRGAPSVRGKIVFIDSFKAEFYAQHFLRYEAHACLPRKKAAIGDYRTHDMRASGVLYHREDVSIEERFSLPAQRDMSDVRQARQYFLKRLYAHVFGAGVFIFRELGVFQAKITVKIAAIGNKKV